MYNRRQHLHFIGIGGVGMAGIAEVLANLGYSVGGSDVRSSDLVEHLRSLGIRISIGHLADNLSKDTSVVVYSSAIAPENPEMLAAQANSIPIIPRAEMLAELMRMKYGVAVAGSHGKTTTTSLAAKILSDAGLSPTVIIGGRILSGNSGASLGTGDYLVTEADESDGSFCMLRPAIAVVTNIDHEHMSHYRSFGALEESFERFMSSVPFYGLVVGCYDDPIVGGICNRLKRRVCSYGLNRDFDFCAERIEIEQKRTHFDLYIRGREEGRFCVNLPGIHMVKNALAALAVAHELGVSTELACKAIADFAGVSRRSEVLLDTTTSDTGYLVIDDYGHHPTEIKATLSSLRKAYADGRRMVVLFQPHRYSRTRELFSDFLVSFPDADLLFVMDVYAADEPHDYSVTGEKLCAAMHHDNVKYVGGTDSVLKIVMPEIRPGDVIVSLGAGSVTKIGQEIARLLSDSTE